MIWGGDLPHPWLDAKIMVALFVVCWYTTNNESNGDPSD
jgi:hypothetical protein